MTRALTASVVLLAIGFAGGVMSGLYVGGSKCQEKIVRAEATVDLAESAIELALIGLKQCRVETQRVERALGLLRPATAGVEAVCR